MPEPQSCHAMEMVLAIPELLEAVLVQVDMRTLLVSASRVSRTWKAFMDESPALQEALFFKPVSDVSGAAIRGLEGTPFPEVPSGYALPHHADDRLINPLLAEKFDKCFFDFGPTYSCHRRANSFFELPWSTCPEPIQTVQEYWGFWSQRKPRELDEASTQALAESRERFTRRGASWRRMLVSQPPPPSLGYMCFDIQSLAVENQHVTSALIQPGSSRSASAGLRMGELYDVVQHTSGHHGRHSLWFRVLWGRPSARFAFTHVGDTFEALTARTGVVVEFMHADDHSIPNHPQDPADVKLFDASFRCEEFRKVEIEAEQTGTGAAEFPHFHPGHVVWHWKLTEA